jgi:sugar phosphate isomerase/epimerase
MTRRSFVRAGALGVAALTGGARPFAAAPLGMPIGCQLYPVREMLGKDVDGTLKQLADIGYKMVEMCSPQGYGRPGGGGFGALLGMTAKEVKQKIKAAGLGCESSHYVMRELKENLSERIDYAKDLGLKQMILSSFGLPRDAKLSDWARVAGELNKIAEQSHKAGLQAGFHNHAGEFAQLDGVLIYDKLMSELDPKLVKMQFQVSVVSLGYEAATFFEKYPGRFISLHLQDYSSADKKTVAVGQGSVDWKKLFTAAKKGGVKNYFVELNLDMMKASYQYLHDLKV